MKNKAAHRRRIITPVIFFVISATSALALLPRASPEPTATATGLHIPLAQRIHDIQGVRHLSPMEKMIVSDVAGIVTAKRASGFFMQDPVPDADPRTSEGIFVFASDSLANVAVGDKVSVGGTVIEQRQGPTAETNANLTVTQINSSSVTVLSSGNPLPAAITIGTGGRVPPANIIEDDASGNVETVGVFDPASDGIDFYESLEGMLVVVNDAVVMGTKTLRGGVKEIPLVGDKGRHAGVRTPRGGIIIRPNDFNPERIFLSGELSALPDPNVGDRFRGSITGVIDYSFGNYKLIATTTPKHTDGGLTREVTAAATKSNQLSIAAFNVENLDAHDDTDKFQKLASIIVINLKSPDIISVEEIQDNNGPQNDAVVDATETFERLISAIRTAGGPAYAFRDINPIDDQDGGETGGNIRIGFLFRRDRGLKFIDRPGGGPTIQTTIVKETDGPRLSISPGRIEPTNAAFAQSRKPLAGEFTFNGHKLFVIANHFSSKGGDQPLFGRFQPPALSSETRRKQQAQIVNGFVNSILAADRRAKVIVMGDLNDFEFSATLSTLKGSVLRNLIETLPRNERYTYVFDGNSQALDHILVTGSLLNSLVKFDVVHINSEFSEHASDHDPTVAIFKLSTLK
jgi:Predicted extracellular nuclease